jgi:hypothetical protein
VSGHREKLQACEGKLRAAIQDKNNMGLEKAALERELKGLRGQAGKLTKVVYSSTLKEKSGADLLSTCPCREHLHMGVCLRTFLYNSDGIHNTFTRVDQRIPVLFNLGRIRRCFWFRLPFSGMTV